MEAVDKNIQWYQSRFDVFEQSLDGEKSTQLHSARRDAISSLAEIGFPTTRQEEWRFTNIAPITKIDFQPILKYESNGVVKSDLEKFLLKGAVHAVYINGMFSKELSDIDQLPDGVILGSLAEAIKKYPDLVQPNIAKLVKSGENAFTALNTAFLKDGAFLSVEKNIDVNRPVQLVFVATDKDFPFTAQPRNLIIAGTGSKCLISETYVSLAKNKYFTNTVSEIVLGENSHIEHDKLQVENTNSFHVGTIQVRMDESAKYISNSVSLGGALVRNNITAVLDAENCECTLNGLTLTSGSQVIDNHTAIDHAKPHCSSHELYKAILDDESKSVFNGKIFVRKDAQKTDAKQTNKTLLLSDGATINAKPQLEIFADDVKCTHGASIGQLDDEQVFYLRTRGIGLAAARDILTFAFAGDIINRITFENMRAEIEKMIRAKLDSKTNLSQTI